MKRTAFLYSDLFSTFDYGLSHPLKPFRLHLTFELIRACGLLSLQNARYVEARMADEKDLLLFHTPEYLDLLREANTGALPAGGNSFGLGPGDNPVFRGLLDWSRLVAGATLQAAALVESGEVDIAFNISGGLHHAGAARASGFCYVNDPAIAIEWLLGKGRRIAYVDIDAHHGDGVQEAFYSTDQVLTISIHETGEMLFPGTGFAEEIGEGRGKGYSVNIPMPSFADDALFIHAFSSVVPQLIDAFSPDIVVSQLGVDTFSTDPLAHLNYTTNGFCEVLRRLIALSPKMVALGGGGYDIANVARAWTLAWAVMNGCKIPDVIPGEFLDMYSSSGFRNNKLRDREYAEDGTRKERMREDVDRVIQTLQAKVIPLVKERK